MVSATEAFISNFHSLTGITVGERRKNLFLLLNKIQAGDEIDFSSVHPKTPLEETFKVDALIYFRRVPDLLEVLKSENPVLIKKVLKSSPWFLERAFQSVSEDELVTLFFPYVSFNVKVKIVNKLSVYLRDVGKADALFKAIRQKYGSYLAFKLLPACSKDFILQTVADSRAYLSSGQVLVIIKKYPESSMQIFSALSSYKSSSSVELAYKDAFDYLARTHHQLFLELYNKYTPLVRLGWRATHKFICNNKEIVIRDVNQFHKLLHKKQSYKTLKQDFGAFYLNLFPVSVEQFPSSFPFLLSLLREYRTDEEKLNFLEANFRKMYGSELLDNPECVNLTLLLDLLPLGKRERIPCKPSKMSEDLWNCYMKIEQSIPYLKMRISLSSDVATREALVVNLVETCRINKNPKALGEVCKYVVNQHRNDNVNVRLAFLAALRRCFELHALHEEHWTYINELLQIFEMNREKLPHSLNFLLAFIHHRLLKKDDVREQLADYIKAVNGGWNLFKHIPAFEKQCLLLTGELLPQIFDEKTLKHRNVVFLNSLVDWNQRHPEDEISLFHYPAAMDSFKQILLEFADANCASPTIQYILNLKSDDSNLWRLCLSTLNLYSGNRKIVNKFMHLKPLFVLDNFDIISQLVFNSSNLFFWRQCRNYTHLEIPQKFGAACCDAVVAEVPGYQIDLIKRNAILGLSYLMNADKFLEFAAEYYPTELKADALTEEARKRYKLQRAVGGYLKNVIPPSLALESILNFSRGDYLKLIQSSLYSVSGNVTEDKLPLFFSELGNRAVSVRKHTFHLTLRVLQRSAVFSVFQKFMETEKNPSIRKFLLKGSFNLFIQDPGDSLWELLKSNINAVNENDREAVQILLEFSKIPIAYKVRYILFIWKFLGNLPDPDGVNEIEKFKLLRSLPVEVIQMLPKIFCSEIIEKHLFKFNYSKQTSCNMDSFACKFIIYCASEIEQEVHINAILLILKRYVCDDKWNIVVNRFVRQFCSEFLNGKCLSRRIFSTFTDLWNVHIKPYQAFDYYLYLQFCLISIDSKNQNLSCTEIGESLAKLIDSLSEVYGTAVVSIVSSTLILFLRYFIHNSTGVAKVNQYLLIEGMIKGNVSQSSLITAISLIKRSQDISGFPKHDGVIQYLSQLDDPIVQIHLNHHLYRF